MLFLHRALGGKGVQAKLCAKKKRLVEDGRGSALDEMRDADKESAKDRGTVTRLCDRSRGNHICPGFMWASRPYVV